MIPVRTSWSSTVAVLLLGFSSIGTAATDKPNILLIWGDDIGQSNISAYTHGLVG